MSLKAASADHPSTTDGGDRAPLALGVPDKKSLVEGAEIMAGEPKMPKDFPWTWKAIALISGIALSWGSSFSENTLGPLKSTLISQLDITNAQVKCNAMSSRRHENFEVGTNSNQYGAISSATSLVNTILPIIGGYGLDYYGVEW